MQQTCLAGHLRCVVCTWRNFAAMLRRAVSVCLLCCRCTVCCMPPRQGTKANSKSLCAGVDWSNVTQLVDMRHAYTHFQNPDAADGTHMSWRSWLTLGLWSNKQAADAKPALQSPHSGHHHHHHHGPSKSSISSPPAYRIHGVEKIVLCMYCLTVSQGRMHAVLHGSIQHKYAPSARASSCKYVAVLMCFSLFSRAWGCLSVCLCCAHCML